MNHNSRIAALAVTIFFAAGINAPNAAESYARFIGDPSPAFDDTNAIVDALKADLGKGDKNAVTRLLGLNPQATEASDDFDDSFAKIQKQVAEGVTVKDIDVNRRVLLLGTDLWPFPFPLVKSGGAWHFDTVAGLDEVINRRIGENELAAIDTAKSYVDAQQAYYATDWDDDGVAEYAQKLISAPGQYDGLYWEPGDGVPDSPAGPFVSTDELKDAKNDQGYFGYRFRVLKGQGDNVAGGRYDYVINGNMIAGFALVAWPVTYGETGMMTFMVGQNGTVYQKDLGPNTDKIAASIVRFDPDRTWSLAAPDEGLVSMMPEGGG